MVMRTDCEPSILAWITKVAAGRAKLHCVDAVAEESARGDSEAHAIFQGGGADQEAQEAGQSSSGITVVEGSSRQRPSTICAGGQMVGLRKREFVEFSSQIMKSLGGKVIVQFSDKFGASMYLETTAMTDEILVGTDRGVSRARNFKRLPNEQRSDNDALSKLVGAAWTFVASDAAADALPVTLRLDALFRVS